MTPLDRLARTPDSIAGAVDLLQSEIEEINRAVMRLAARKDRLEEAIRVLREHADPEAAARALPGVSERAASTNGHAPTAAEEPAPRAQRVPTAQVVRAHLRRAPERWFTATDLKRETERPPGQIGQAVRALFEQHLIDREDIDPIEITEGRAHARCAYRYRWADRAGAAT